MNCDHDYVPITRRGIAPVRGKLCGLHRCKRCGDTVRRIEPDMIVRHVGNGKVYRVRSVSKTKAVCQPTKTHTWHAVEYDQAKLAIVRLRAA